MAFLWSLVLWAGVHLTVYEANLAVVEETRSFPLKAGPQTLRLSDLPPNLDPQTVSLHLPGVRLRALRFHRRLAEPQRVLDLWRGQRVTLLLRSGEAITGTLWSADPSGYVVQTRRGAVVVPRDPVLQVEGPWPEDSLAQTPFLKCLVEAPKEGTYPGTLRYHISGLSWQVRYRADLRDHRLDLQGTVWLSNRTEHTYRNASLFVVYVELHRVTPTPMFTAEARGVKAQAPSREQPVAEYHLYPVPGTHTLPAQSDLQIPLLDAHHLPMHQEYWYRYGTQISWWLVFQVPEQPLPAGVVAVYQDHEGRPVLVGEDQIRHTPAGDTLALRLGTAFDLRAREERAAEERVGGHLWRTTWHLRFWNFKGESVEIRVLREMPRGAELVDSRPVSPVKQWARQLEFRVSVPARGTADLSYTLQYPR